MSSDAIGSDETGTTGSDKPAADLAAELSIGEPVAVETLQAREAADVRISPIRAPETAGDVSLDISVGDTHIRIPLNEDEVLALEDMMHQALEVPALE